MHSTGHFNTPVDPIIFIHDEDGTISLLHGLGPPRFPLMVPEERYSRKRKVPIGSATTAAISLFFEGSENTFSRTWISAERSFKKLRRFKILFRYLKTASSSRILHQHAKYILIKCSWMSLRKVMERLFRKSSGLCPRAETSAAFS